MGLLDALGSDEGLLGLALMAGGSAKPVRTGLGEGLLQGMQLVQQNRNAREDRAQRQRMQQMQEQAMQMQMEDRKRMQAQQAQRGQLLNAMDANQGPPMQPTMPQLIGAGFNQQEIGMLTPQQADPMAGFDKLSPKDYTPESIQQFMQTRNPAVLRAAPKDDKPPADWQLYQLSGAPQRGMTFDQWDQARRRAGASNVSVPINMGQKGFDNTLKLRGDFRGEPIYKAHQEMQSAYSQIQQSLKQASPAGDLAGATKIMKLLDPGSVVRESELGMAMAASGLMDRVANYADNIIKGTKLTPTQRADFQRLADALFAESVKQYNAKRSEYQGIAERNQLNVQDVLGAESAGPMPANGGWSIKPKGP